MTATAAQDAAMLAAIRVWLKAELASPTPTLPPPPVPPPTTPPPPTPTVPPVSGLPDGSDKAPTGLPQLPVFFGRYPGRPAWMVPGVDYRVGINTGVVLKDPRKGGLPAGVNPFFAGNSTVNISGSNVVLDGWDFTGIQLLVGGNAGEHPSNILIRNCKFASGGSPGINLAWNNVLGPVTVEYCEFTGINTNEGIINWAPGSRTAKCTVQYCYIHDCPGDGPDWKLGGQITFRFNFVYNQALGGLAHLDQMVCGDGACDFQPFKIEYNFFLSDGFISAGHGTQGQSFDGNYHSTAFITRGGSWSKNVYVNRTTGADNSCVVTFGIRLETTLIQTGTVWNVQDNYIDDTGGKSPRGWGWNFIRNTHYGPQAGKAVLSGNVDLVTGTKPANWNLTIG